jgi:tripartite-type tricarboxylate transporter receptor subunit TctC
MQFGSPGAGSVPHLACVLLNRAVDIDVTHVPYRGAVPALQDLIAVRIDYQCVALAPAIAYIESKMITAMAVFTRKRSPSLPDLASVREQGFPGVEASTWYAMFLPKGTPASIVRKLNVATADTLDTPAAQERLREVGVEPVEPQRRSPEYLQKFVESEIVKWAGAIKTAGVGGL